MTADWERILRPEARSVVATKATSTEAIDASLQADADIRVPRLSVDARIIVVGCDLRAVSGVEPENGVGEVAAILRTSAPEVCCAVAEVGLSRKGGRLLDHNEVVASLGDERLVGICSAVVAIGAVNDGERHEANPKE